MRILSLEPYKLTFNIHVVELGRVWINCRPNGTRRVNVDVVQFTGIFYGIVDGVLPIGVNLTTVTKSPSIRTRPSIRVIIRWHGISFHYSNQHPEIIFKRLKLQLPMHFSFINILTKNVLMHSA